MVQAITRKPKEPGFIGPEMKYKNVIFDTLKICDRGYVKKTIDRISFQVFDDTEFNRWFVIY